MPFECYYLFFLWIFFSRKYWYPLLISIPEKLLPITRIKDDDDRRLDGQLGRWPHVDGESVLATVALSVLSAFIGIVIILISFSLSSPLSLSLSPLPSSAQILLRLDFSAFMCLVLGSLCCMWLLDTFGGTHYWDGQVKIICSSQPSMVHWLSSSIFPYSFVCPAMVTSQFLLAPDPPTHTFSESLWQ